MPSSACKKKSTTRVGVWPGRGTRGPGAGDPQPPARQAGVPAGPGDLRTEPQMTAQAIAVGDLFQVVPDLWLPGEAVRPGGVRREREGVKVRRDVAGAPGIGVVPPGAAHRDRPLEDDEAGHARLPQPDARAEPAEAGADDGDAHMFRHGVSVPDLGPGGDLTRHPRGCLSETHGDVKRIPSTYQVVMAALLKTLVGRDAASSRQG